MLVYKQPTIIIIISFTISGFLLRFLLADFTLEYDGKLYYEYAATLAFQGSYPETITELHNIGWVFFLVPFFKVIGPNQEMLFFAQHIISIVISTGTIPMSYLFAKRFLPDRYAVFVPLLFAVDYRMAQNAGFGITEPLVMILSLAAYWTKNRLFMFVFVGFACLVRFEAIMLIPVLLIIHKDKRLIPYVAIPVFILLALFVVNNSMGHSDQVVSKVSHEIEFVNHPSDNVTNNSNYWIKGLSNSLLYMVWAAFPTFVFSIYGILKHRWLFIVLAILSISGIYAYLDAYDTRYFFPMYPFLALASAYAFERLQVNKFVGIR